MQQPNEDPTRVRDVIIVGAGPAGLASAIAAHKAGLVCEVIEHHLYRGLVLYPRMLACQKFLQTMPLHIVSVFQLWLLRYLSNFLD